MNKSPDSADKSKKRRKTDSDEKEQITYNYPKEEEKEISSFPLDSIENKNQKDNDLSTDNDDLIDIDPFLLDDNNFKSVKDILNQHHTKSEFYNNGDDDNYDNDNYNNGNNNDNNNNNNNAYDGDDNNNNYADNDNDFIDIDIDLFALNNDDFKWVQDKDNEYYTKPGFYNDGDVKDKELSIILRVNVAFMDKCIVL
jgi:hypothetical protein